MRKLVFIFLNKDARPKEHQSIVTVGAVQMITIGVKDYDEACEMAKCFAAEGVAAIELCGGFGNMGVAKVTEAVSGKIPVGVIRFDNHPGFDGESGDERF